MPRSKTAIEKVLEAWKTLQPAEKAAVLATIKLDLDIAKPKVVKRAKPAPLTAVE